MVEGNCLQAMKIVHHQIMKIVADCFDWLISGQRSVYPLREAISILFEKYKKIHLCNPVANDQFHGMCIYVSFHP